MGHGAPNLPGLACNWGHLTHRGARQDQEGPQLLSEVGKQQAAQPAAIRGGLRAYPPGRGFQGSLHVPGAVLPGSADTGRRTALGPPQLQSPPLTTAPSPPSALLSARPASRDLGPAPYTPKPGS